MKLKLFFIAFIFTATIFSQGIAVQGIARNSTESAITDTNLNFEVSIVNEQKIILFKEEKSIRTDNFGVFSHVVGTGDAITNTFNSVNFALKELRIKITIADSGETVVVYDLPFQYVPYAKYADNGVPTGTMMPFAGEKEYVPAGWLLCDGEEIPDTDTNKSLIDIVGSKTPNLKGRVLRGTGRAENNDYVGPPLRGFQNDQNEDHRHGSGTLKGETYGNSKHSHSLDGTALNYKDGTDKDTNGENGEGSEISQTDEDGQHEHKVDIDGGYTGSQGGLEVRVASYGVNYIIKI
jgi:microcystin-dependent protein